MSEPLQDKEVPLGSLTLDVSQFLPTLDGTEHTEELPLQSETPGPTLTVRFSRFCTTHTPSWLDAGSRNQSYLICVKGIPNIKRTSPD
jgi:hypothetical protein